MPRELMCGWWEAREVGLYQCSPAPICGLYSGTSTAGGLYSEDKEGV